MKIFYIFLLLVLLGTFGSALNRVSKAFGLLTPILGWMVGLAYFFIAPLTILTLNGGFKFSAAYQMSGNWGEVDLSKLQFMGPYLVIWLSLMFTCAVACFLIPAPTHGWKVEKHLVSLKQLQRVILITMGISLLDWVFTIWLNGGLAEFLISHWYRRQEDMVTRFGSLFVLYKRCSLVNQIVFTGAAVLYMSEGLKHRKVRWKFLSLIFLFLLLGMVMSGNRIFIATYLLGFLASCWLFGRKKILVTMLAASPLLVLVFSAWGWVRQDVSKIPDSLDTYVVHSDVENPSISKLMEVTEGSAITLLMHLINDFGDKYEYLYGSTYSRLFTFFEPRSLHPERTPDFGTLTATLYEPGETTSFTSTPLGEAYANFGFFGIFVPPLFTWLALSYSRRLALVGEKHTLLTAVSFVMFIWFARSPFAENGMTLIGAALLIWVLRLESSLCTRNSDSRGLVNSPNHTRPTTASGLASNPGWESQ
jgi:oligosaccharide repeat unit polymerase